VHTRFEIDYLQAIAEKLCEKPVNDITEGRLGANSRIFKVHCNGECFALKFYRASSAGQCSRVDAESRALRFFEQHEVTSTPRLIAVDVEDNCSLIEWIDGEKVDDINIGRIEALSGFLSKLHTLRNIPEATDFCLGTEACLSVSELLRQLDMRINRLGQSVDNNIRFKRFLDNEFFPVIKTIGGWVKESVLNIDEELSRDLQTLSPVDFGFHNVIIRDDDSMIFLDFEYFGWADPVNLISDTLLHPANKLSEKQKQLFFNQMFKIYENDPNLLKRLKVFYPLYGLRWCAIMLNQFLPGYIMLGEDELTDDDKQRLKEEKLNRVRNFMQEIYKSYKDFPYVK